MDARAKMIVGTSSDAGKSTVVAAICRYLSDQGVRVVPFKSQNMALNSAVTVDGYEIGRAQYAQAIAARVPPTVHMNPILLKPESERRSQLILLGEPVGTVDAQEFQRMKPSLLKTVVEAYETLARDADVVIIEGAGSPAEINLLDNDIVNLRLAETISARAAIVADIDRGGVFAHLLGTYAILPKALSVLLDGYLINKFRGDASLLDSGTAQLSSMIDSPCFGVLPFLSRVMPDREDSLSLAQSGSVSSPVGSQTYRRRLQVRVVRLPHISNYTDFDALESEPSVDLSYVDSRSGLLGADVVILPGTKSTVSDLVWLEGRFGDSIHRFVQDGGYLVGICGGYQMMGRSISDAVESGVDSKPSLGLLDVVTTFHPRKLTLQRTGTFSMEQASPPVGITGYQIHNGRVDYVGQGSPLFQLEASPVRRRFIPGDGEAGPEGIRLSNLIGTTLHGVFDSDGFRRSLLSEVARNRGCDYSHGPSFSKTHDEHYGGLAGWLSAATADSGFLQWLQE